MKGAAAVKKSTGNVTGSETPEAYSALFMDAVRAAKEAGASDLHIEPTRTGLVIRMRVFGDMQPAWKEISDGHRQSFLSQVKKLAGLEIGVSGKPQDGRLALPSLDLDLRTSLLPTLYGEKIVMRLLDLGRKFVLSELGMTPDSEAAIRRALRSRDGVVLISGPTGSGKTTTLYTMLSTLDRSSTNIVTLEDPVEYSIDGINQVQITGRLSFASALRSVLRQDPDVILIGEIRDPETATLAFQAAATGHLVLSTIHANSAAQVVTRLTGLGVEPFLIETALRYSGAQRLLRRLCPRCSVPATEEGSAKFLEANHMKGLVIKNPVTLRLQGPGCSACHGGITGRIPVVEYLMGSEIELGLNAKVLKGQRSMADAVLEQVAAGALDMREVDHYV